MLPGLPLLPGLPALLPLLVLFAVLGGSVGLTGCSSTGPTKRAADEPYAFWPPPPDAPRVQYLRSYRVSSDIEPEPGALERIVLGTEAAALPIAKPYGIDVWKDRIYVCDITNPGVVILDLAASQTRLMVARGVEQMAQPTDIAIADDGMKYVIDRRLGRVFVFSADDRHVATFGEKGLVPAGVAVHGDELYVADFDTQSVLVLDRHRGIQLRSIGGPGGNDGEFVRPLGLADGPDGELFVADAIRGCLQKFDRDGNFMLSIGQISDVPGNFVRPKHVTVDREGYVYVVDAAFQNVQVFGPEGELLMFFGGSGRFPGAMNLPAGIAVWEGANERFAADVHPAFEASRYLVVSNQFGSDKVAVYAFGKLKPGRTVADIAPSAAELVPMEPVPAAGTPTLEELSTDSGPSPE